jgi:hypothetical protein
MDDLIKLARPHPKSLSLRERDFDSYSPLLPGRGAGGEGLTSMFLVKTLT